MADDYLVSEISNVTTNCTWSITWAKDESVLSYITYDENRVFVWKTDGSMPYAVGTINADIDSGTW
jgi:hypothetical protein